MKAEYKIHSQHRFEVRYKQNDKIEGTGCFTHSKEDLNEKEQFSFFHEYTNNMYKNKEQFFSIRIYKVQE